MRGEKLSQNCACGEKLQISCMLIEFAILAMFCSYIHGSFHIQGSFHNKFNIFFGSFDIHTSFDIHRSVHNHAHSSGINTCQSILPIILLCKPSLVRPSPLHINPGKEITLIKHNVKNIFGHCLFGVPGLNACLGLKNLDLVNIVNFFTCRLSALTSMMLSST